jgi:putative ABC transport system permease protein
MAILKLAVRNLKRNRRRTAITLLAMVVGVGVMVALRGFINGQQITILENVVDGRLGAVQVHRAGYVKNVLTSPLVLDMADTPELREKIRNTPKVVAVAPRIDFGAMVSMPDQRTTLRPEQLQASLPKGTSAAEALFRLRTVLAVMLSKVNPQGEKLDVAELQRRMLAAIDAEKPTASEADLEAVRQFITTTLPTFDLSDLPQLEPNEDGSLTVVEPGKTSFFLATAIEPESEAKVTPQRSGLVKNGRMFPTANTAELVLNAEFAVGLDGTIHDPAAPLPPVEQQVALMSGDRDGALNGENVVLGGTFPTFSPGDKRVGLVPLTVAQRLLRMEGRVTEYGVAVDRIESADEVAEVLRGKLGPDYEVHTWNELFPFIKTLMGTQDVIFSIISAVFLAVVLLGIVNSMLMTVLERTREIGTMLAVGMKRRQIVQLFLLEGAVIGAVGATLGLLVGFAAVSIAHSKGIPLPSPGATVPSIVRPFVSPRFIIGAFVGTPLGAAVATLWPAYRAALLRPVEALQSA